MPVKVFKDFKNEVEIVTTGAEEAANEFAAANQTEAESSKTQIRKFYQEYVMIIGNIGEDEKRFDENLVRIKMLISKASYAKSRADFRSNIKNFYDWIISNIKDVNTLKDAKTFRLYFEAMLGYFALARATNQTNNQQRGGQRFGGGQNR